MKTQFNVEEYRREWVLTRWYEKTAYVFGSAWLILLAISFGIGLIAGILENL